MLTDTQRPNRKHTCKTPLLTGCCFREYARTVKQFVRNAFTFFKYFLFCPMKNDQTVCRLYFLSEQNIILPPAELPVSLSLKAIVANLHCTDWLHVCMLCVGGRGGGQFSLLCFSASGQMDLSKLFRPRSDCSVVCLIRVYAVYFHTTHPAFGYTCITFQY